MLAQCTLVEEGRDRAMIEILAAPLSENGTAIDSILCAVSISPFETGAVAHSHEANKHSGIAIFALGSSNSLGQQVARHLHAELTPHEEREFEDGEHKTRPLVNVRDRDVYVVSALHSEESRSRLGQALSPAVLYRSAQGCPAPLAFRRWLPISAMRARTVRQSRAIR